MTNTWWHRVFEPSVYGVVPQLYKDAGVVDDMSAPATTLEENIKKLAQMPLIAHPGTMFDYSTRHRDPDDEHSRIRRSVAAQPAPGRRRHRSCDRLTTPLSGVDPPPSLGILSSPFRS